MNELRWILIAAGILLIVGLYAWGMRSRARQQPQAEPKPPVFTGGATGFEPAPPAARETAVPEEADEDALEVPAVERSDRRRIEPSLDAGSPPPIARTSDRTPTFDEELPSPTAPLAPTGRREGRREPTLQTRAEPVAPRAEVTPPSRPRPAPVEEPPHAPAEPEVEPAPAKAARPAQKIVALRVTAPATARFDGGHLLEALQTEGLTYGRYEIFHRLHDDGRPLFSVASLKEPGTFDLDAMASTQYPGIAFFTVLPGPLGALEAFDEMVFTARALAHHLGGSMTDERGAPLTAHRIGRLREEALDFERAPRSG